MPASTPNTYLWCDACRRSFSHDHAPDGTCPVCGGPLQPIGKFNAILRGLMANELSPSPLYSKHQQLVKLMWTQHGMGEQYYRILAPEMAYNRFESAMTRLLCRGADEGWVTFAIPSSPRTDEAEYRMVINDEARFMDEIQVLAGPDAAVAEGE